MIVPNMTREEVMKQLDKIMAIELERNAILLRSQT